MKTSIIERHAEIRKIVDLWHKSKRQMRQPDFCKKEGISLDSLKYWITKFNKEQASKQSDPCPSGFIPVKVENTAEQAYQEIEFPNGVIFRYSHMAEFMLEKMQKLYEIERTAKERLIDYKTLQKGTEAYMQDLS